jgi:hypothetical protein
MAKQSQQLVLMLTIGILIGVAGVMALKTRTAGEEEQVTVNTTESGATTSVETVIAPKEIVTQAPNQTLPPSVPKNSRIGLSVEDQSAGDVVNITHLNILDSNWIAVYDEREGQPGYIMGARRVHAGDSETQIELLRPTIKGEHYYVSILSDDGGDTFDRQTDLPPLTPDKVIIVSFVAQ